MYRRYKRKNLKKNVKKPYILFLWLEFEIEKYFQDILAINIKHEEILCDLFIPILFKDIILNL